MYSRATAADSQCGENALLDSASYITKSVLYINLSDGIRTPEADQRDLQSFRFIIHPVDEHVNHPLAASWLPERGKQSRHIENTATRAGTCFWVHSQAQPNWVKHLPIKKIKIKNILGY